METHGKITEPGTIRFERLLPGPIERVWSYLTDSDKRGRWLAKGEMEAFEGGKVTLEFMHSELSPVKEHPPEKYKEMECGHAFTGTVLKYQPPHLLSFTWNDDSIVTIELSEQGKSIFMVLTHHKLGTDKKNRVSVASGWHTHLGIMKAYLEGLSPEGFWSVQQRLEAEYDKLI